MHGQSNILSLAEVYDWRFKNTNNKEKGLSLWNIAAQVCIEFEEGLLASIVIWLSR